MFGSAKVTLERPNPAQVSHITHHSLQLHWEEALAAASAVVGVQSADNRVLVTVQQLSPGGVEEWHEVYKGYGKSMVLDNLSPFSQYKFRLKMQWKEVESPWSRATLCTTARSPLHGDHIHRAVARADLAALQHVLNTGVAYVDATNKYDFTALMEATRNEYLGMMNLLVENGANVNFQNSMGKTALMLAASMGKMTPVQELRRLGASYEVEDTSGSTALHWACLSKNAQLVDWMLQDGADVSATNHLGRTPLMLLASVEDRYDVANVLLRNGAKVNVEDKQGQTPLMLAVNNGFTAIADLFLQKNADINIKTATGKTIKQVALASDKKLVVECFQLHLERLKKET